MTRARAGRDVGRRRLVRGGGAARRGRARRGRCHPQALGRRVRLRLLLGGRRGRRARASPASSASSTTTFSFGDDFDDHVVEPYLADHAAGRTPNPCIECNRHLKFDRLIRRADALGFEAVATGHHARIVETTDGTRRVARGADPAKDQSYVVHVLRAGDAGSSPVPGGPPRQGRRPGRGRPAWPPPPSPTARTCASSRPPAAATPSSDPDWRPTPAPSSIARASESVRSVPSSW